MKDKLPALSFFSGCLGLDLGLEKAGFRTVFACEFDKNCQQTIKKNKPSLPIVPDILDCDRFSIRKLAGLSAKERPSLIFGGPPCQAFSTAGKRQAFTDPRGNVFLKYIDLIGELLPDFAVIENVRGLLSASLKHRPLNSRGTELAYLDEDEVPGSALNLVLNRLKSFGYRYSFNLYNSANYGVPQIRERVFLIASLKGSKPPYIAPTHSDHPEFGLPGWVTFRTAIKGLRENKMTFTRFPESRLRYYRMLKSGQYWKDLASIDLQKEALGKSYFSGGGKTGFLRRIDWNRPCPTLVTSPTMPATDLAHPEKDRPLSIEEYKRIQQFPDSWNLVGDIASQYRQLGNAVPVGMGQALGRTLRLLIEKKSPSKIPQGFFFSRYKNTDQDSWSFLYKKTACCSKDSQLSLTF